MLLVITMPLAAMAVCVFIMDILFNEHFAQTPCQVKHILGVCILVS